MSKIDKEKYIQSCNPLFSLGVAHRGLYNNEKGITENSIEAFKNAIAHQVAFEFDIHLTKDNQLAVIHDSDLKRLTGKDGIVEDLTLKELKENYTLLNGAKIPSFEEVLALGHDDFPMVIELKVYRKNYRPLTKRFLQAMKGVKNKENYNTISFDPRALFPLKKLGILRQLLVCQGHFWVFKLRYFFEAIDIENTLLDNPRVKSYYRNHFVNAWTIENKDVFDRILPECDTITYQFLDPAYVKEQLKEKNKKYLQEK